MDLFVVRALLVVVLNRLYDDVLLNQLRVKVDPDLYADALFWSNVRFWVYVVGLLYYICLRK